MFGWFKKRDNTAIYSPKDRLLFGYWNGNRFVDADPLVLFSRYLSVRPELAIDMKLANSDHKDAHQGHAKAVVKIRTIFDIAAPDNPIEPKNTLSENEIESLLFTFL